MEQTKKLNEITFLQSFGIFLVVLGHSYPIFDYSPSANWIYHFIYSFHMPLFMSISGFLFIYTGGTKNRFTDFLTKKFYRLLIPYLVLNTIAYLPKTFLSEFADRPLELGMAPYLKSLFYPDESAISFFWFLPTLFLIFVISPLLSKALQNVSSSLVLTIILATLYSINPFQQNEFLSVDNIASYLLFFWAGCVMCRFKIFYEKLITNPFVGCFSIILLLWLSQIYIYSTFLSVITALLGIIMSFSLTKMLSEKKLNVFRFIDGYSYQIYLLSWFPQIFIKIVFFQALGFNFYASSLLMLLSGLFIPIFITKILIKYNSRLLPAIGLNRKVPPSRIQVNIV